MKDPTSMIDFSDWRAVSVAASCLLLAGCAATDPAVPPSESPPRTTAAPKKAAVESTVPRPKRKPLAFSVDPRRLVNLDEREIRDAMGDPPSISEKPPAIVWSYTKGDCRLDLYLYQSLKTRRLRSLAYVLEPTRGAAAANPDCRKPGK